jgi:Ribbon-helix-helix protein, copG family
MKKPTQAIENIELNARLTIKIPKDELKELKILAIQNDMNLSELVRLAIKKLKAEMK